MPHTRSTATWLLVGLLLRGTAAATTLAPGPEATGAIELPRGLVTIEDRGRQESLTQTPAWLEFTARHGPWNVLWNEVTGTPHRAFGRGIALAGFANEPAAVDAAVRRFVAASPGLFGDAPELETAAVLRAGAVWYVRYRQLAGGIPLLFADWEFRVGENGRLFAFGADAHPFRTDAPTRPILVDAVVRKAATRGLAFDPATDRVEGGERLHWLPYPTDDGIDYRLVRDAIVITTDPPRRWITYVDAVNGAVLWRHDLVRWDVHGSVSGEIHPALPTDALVPRNLPHLAVMVGTTTVYTDSAGGFGAPATGTVPIFARLRGRYAHTVRQDAPSAIFDVFGADPARVDVAFRAGNSHDAERDGYYHVTRVHDWIRALDPGLTLLDYAIMVRVNFPATCNAFWDGTSLNFFSAGNGCPNTATMPDVVYHEYGHVINDVTYLTAGASQGMQNGALHEGLADVNAGLLLDTPDIGNGFLGPGTVLRRLENTLRWPEDRSSDPHRTGLIIGGAFWDLRQAVGLSVATRLAHYARYGTPDDPDDGVAMGEYFLETLVADDDDADLANGTPHFAEIVAAFNAHGIGTAAFLEIDLEATPDPATPGPHPIVARLRFNGPFGGIAPGSAIVHASVDGTPFESHSMSPTGNADEYRAMVAAPIGSIVRYWIGVTDVYGGFKVLPAGAPARLLSFVAGPVVEELRLDFESDPGWSLADPTDDATTGRWIRAEPVGTYIGAVPVQPEEDHTPAPGTHCFVTGNGIPGFGPGEADVDGGHTTLTSSRFDATAGGIAHPVLDYWRWFTNDAGNAAGEDEWVVEISNDDGSTWRQVERTFVTDNSWRRVLFRIEDAVTPTDRMRVRFVAADLGTGSIVEAAVDDFRVIGFQIPPEVHVDAPIGGERVFGGDLLTLRWTATDDVAVATVDLLLSRSGAAGPFEPLALNEPNDGVFEWRVTTPSTSAALLRVVARDGAGNIGVDESDRAFAIGQRPDCSGARALAALGWPPNRRLVPVTIAGITDPDGDRVSVVVTSVRQNEPVDGHGNGGTCPDAAIAADGTLRVRHERDGGNDRVYTIAFVAADGGGGTCEGTVRVCVPHDRGARSSCVDQGTSVNSLGPCASTRLGPDDFAPVTVLDLRIGAPDGGRATIEYDLPEDGEIALIVFDVAGRRVAALANGFRPAGRHRSTLDLSLFPHGWYLCRLRTTSGSVTRALPVVR